MAVSEWCGLSISLQVLVSSDCDTTETPDRNALTLAMSITVPVPWLVFHVTAPRLAAKTVCLVRQRSWSGDVLEGPVRAVQRLSLIDPFLTVVLWTSEHWRALLSGELPPFVYAPSLTDCTGCGTFLGDYCALTERRL